MTNANVISNNNLYTAANRTSNKASLMDRFRAYIKENGAMIAAGLCAMQGDTTTWRLYMDSNR